MKAISWNVNGVRAVLKKNFLEFLTDESPDILAIQETKWRPEQLTKKDQLFFEESEYFQYWNPAVRPGYSGTAVFSKKEALSVTHGIHRDSFDHESVEYVDETLLENHEGRVTTLEFEGYYFVTVYTPNSKDDLARLWYRYNVWDKAFLQYLKFLESSKPVIICWDLNVAHRSIDLARPKQNTMTAWFTKEEREWMDNYLANWFIDTFREKYPDTPDVYTWWSYRAWARARNVGWRIDYFLISEKLSTHLEEARIYDETLGSDHCPVWIEINI